MGRRLDWALALVLDDADAIAISALQTEPMKSLREFLETSAAE